MRAPRRISRQILAARQVVDECLRRLPPALREAAQPCAIELCDIAAGTDEDDDLLGLFEGCSRMDGEPLTPEDRPRIRLFLDNLWDFTGGDIAAFREEVKTTFLHELGHYLGLDEGQVEELGLA